MTIKVKRPEGTVAFCTDLALRAEWEDAVDRLEQARKDGESDQRLGNVSVVEAASAVQELERRMEALTYSFRLRGLPRKKWQELGEEHPPDNENAQDKAMGVHVATFFDAAAKLSIFAVLDAEGQPLDFDAEAEWEALADEMTNGQWQAFADEVLRLNRSVVEAPFSRTASLLTRDSEQSST
jgi:hypothetical protein